MLDALAQAIDEQIIARPVTLAPKRAPGRPAEAPAARARGRCHGQPALARGRHARPRYGHAARGARDAGRDGKGARPEASGVRHTTTHGPRCACSPWGTTCGACSPPAGPRAPRAATSPQRPPRRLWALPNPRPARLSLLRDRLLRRHARLRRGHDSTEVGDPNLDYSPATRETSTHPMRVGVRLALVLVISALLLRSESTPGGKPSLIVPDAVDSPPRWPALPQAIFIPPHVPASKESYSDSLSPVPLPSSDAKFAHR